MNKLTPILITVLLLSLTIVLADGCFLYPDSVVYCTDISLQEAQEECSFQERCEIQESFKDAVTCSSLPECQKIICKTSCREEFAGRCPEGQVGENDCKTGCCQFDYSSGQQLSEKFCDYTLSQRNCEIEAKNKEATGYFFNTQLNAKSCTLWCGQGKNISNKLEMVTALSSPPQQELTTSPVLRVVINTLLIILGLAAFFYILWRIALKYLPDVDWEHWEEKPKEIWNMFNPFGSNQQAKENIETIKRYHQDKVRKHQREELLGAPIVREDSFHKLKKLTRSGKKEFEALNFEEAFTSRSLSSSTFSLDSPSLPSAKKTAIGKDDLFQKLKRLANK